MQPASAQNIQPQKCVHSSKVMQTGRKFPKHIAEANAVRRRIKKHARIEKLGEFGLELYVLRGFLPLDTCTQMIKLIDSGCTTAPVLTTAETLGWQPSDEMIFPENEPLHRSVDTKILGWSGIDRRKGETLHGQRYAHGQKYGLHNDAFNWDGPFWETERLNGGQRTWTAMVYLNTPEVGGETVFPFANLSLTPEPGMLVFFYSQNENGDAHRAAVHEASEVTAGEKYILVKFFREDIVPPDS
jgi:prolyl 4-hydroxylase